MTKTIDAFYLQRLEVAIVTGLKRRLRIPAQRAMDLYFTSRSAQLIERNDWNYANRDAAYLIDEMLSNEPQHFVNAND